MLLPEVIGVTVGCHCGTVTTRCHSFSDNALSLTQGTIMPVSPGDTMKLTFRGTCFGQRIIYDLAYECTVGNAVMTTGQVLQETINQVTAVGANNILTNLRNAMPPQWSLDEIRAQIISPQRSAFLSNGFAGFVGLNVGAATAAARQGAITRRTDFSGRNQISTLKVGPIPDNASAAGLLTVPYQTLLGLMGTDSIKGLLLPVSTVQWVSTILSPSGLSLGRRLSNFFIQPQSRVLVRRVVGRGE